MAVQTRPSIAESCRQISAERSPLRRTGVCACACACVSLLFFVPPWVPRPRVVRFGGLCCLYCRVSDHREAAPRLGFTFTLEVTWFLSAPRGAAPTKGIPIFSKEIVVAINARAGVA